MRILEPIVVGVGLSIACGVGVLLSAPACGSCDAANVCATNVMYRAYDHTGAVDPKQICGAPAVNDGMLGGGRCGVHFHWSPPSGRCDCDAVVACSSLTGEYDWANCVFTPAGGAASPDLASPPDLASAPDLTGACVDTANDGATIHLLAATGTPPAPTGGIFTDGKYHAVSAAVYATGAPANRDLGTFRGTVVLTGSNVEILYDSMPYQGTSMSFYGSGAFTTGSNQVNIDFTCGSTGPGGTAFGYSVTSASTFDVSTTVGGFATVTSYSM